MINKWKLWLKAAACRSHSAGLLLRSAHLLAAFCRKLGWGNTFDAAALFSSSDTKGGMFGTQRAAKWIIVSLSQGVCLSSDTWEQHEGGSERLSAAGWLMEGKGQDPCKTSSLRKSYTFGWCLYEADQSPTDPGPVRTTDWLLMFIVLPFKKHIQGVWISCIYLVLPPCSDSGGLHVSVRLI